MFSVQFISIEGQAIKFNHDIRNLRVKTTISNGTKKSNFACLSAVVRKDKFGFIHKQKTVERARVFVWEANQGKGKMWADKSPRGFGFKSCLHGQRLPGQHLDLSFTQRVHTNL